MTSKQQVVGATANPQGQGQGQGQAQAQAPVPETVRIQIGETVDYATARTFKTGSRGFWYGGKLTLPNGKRYQVSLSVVEIGSKG